MGGGAGASNHLARLFQDLMIEALSEKEAGLPPQRVEKRADLSDLPLSFGFEQNAENPKRSKTEADGRMTAFLLIEQNEIRSQLKRQSQSLGFSKVEIPSQECCHRPVAHLTTMDPRGILHFLTARMPPPAPVELLPDTLGYVDLTEELPEQLKAADRRKIGDGGGIADDDHGSPS